MTLWYVAVDMLRGTLCDEERTTTCGPFETFRGRVYPARCDATGRMNVRHDVAAFDHAARHLVRGIGKRKPTDPEPRESARSAGPDVYHHGAEPT